MSDPLSSETIEHDGVPDLEVRTVSKHYQQHGKTFTAVDQLSLAVPSGKFCSILGPSGCGKTTLLRMIAGFIKPDQGSILIRGRDMNDVAPNRRPVNMVFQHLALFPMMNVAENVGYGLARRGLSRRDIDARVRDMLNRVGLPDAGAKRIDQLSGGQKQRIAIARALVLEPTLLLLDEPLGALDLKLREHMKIELKQLQAELGTTFVYITHDQSEALVMSDVVAVMNQGRFEQVGTPQDLYYRPQTSFVAGFVGANNCYAIERVERDGDRWRIQCEQGLILSADHATQAARWAFVRPESVQLGVPADEREINRPVGGANAWTGTVQQVIFDGANSSAVLKLGGTAARIQVALPQTGQFQHLRQGDAVTIRLASDTVRCFEN